MEDKKIVLIGGSSSGKSSLTEELERRGYCTIREMARDVIKERAHIKITPKEIEIRQRMIYEKQIEAESDSSGLVFLDRGVLDVVAYSKHLLGYLPFEIRDSRYSTICNLEGLPFVDDGLRVESGNKEAQAIHEKIIDAYTEHNYSFLYIPVIKGRTLKDSISKRADYLLAKLKENQRL